MLKNKFSFQSVYVRIDDGDYEDALAFTLRSMPEERMSELILEFANANHDMLFQLVARMIPMSMDDTVELLHNATKYFQQGNEVMDTRVQSQLTFVVNALLAKGEEQIRKRELLAGACTCFAVIRALEPLLARAADNGELLQRMIKDVFALVRKVTSRDADKETFFFIALLADAQRNESEGRFSEEWRGLIGALRGQMGVGAAVGV